MAGQPTRPGPGSTALAGLCAAALAAPVLAAAAPAAAAADTETRQCVSGDFKIIENDRGAAAGTTYIEFAMIRIGGSGGSDDPAEEPCSLYRDLGVSWVDHYQGSTVGAFATYDGEQGEPFVVEPGGTATLTLAQPNPGNYDPEVCDPTDVAGIRVQWDMADEGAYASTGARDTMCANPDVAVPRYTVEPAQS
ncbi:uncharacterized protein DUF4232 [Nocardiopsis sp. Huas11]|uniref:DUF4232 domain-containing protein n=1 Tax=Nocardiopsis sp. Huas11 TaxID=2183912 RepID=UPI000EACE100|nr:DUF4232 domain-containing protein [Nocardiopsis sp. Huas11]RKS09145.1 uncharacterized protein DUF4232 [Nocardiopsis sp. Huas11]